MDGDGATGAGAAAGGEGLVSGVGTEAPDGSPMRAIGVSIGTVWPSETSSSRSVPANGEVSSVVTLSVSIDARGSPERTASPTRLSH